MKIAAALATTPQHIVALILLIYVYLIYIVTASVIPPRFILA